MTLSFLNSLKMKVQRQESRVSFFLRHKQRFNFMFLNALTLPLVILDLLVTHTWLSDMETRLRAIETFTSLMSRILKLTECMNSVVLSLEQLLCQSKLGITMIFSAMISSERQWSTLMIGFSALIGKLLKRNPSNTDKSITRVLAYLRVLSSAGLKLNLNQKAKQIRKSKKFGMLHQNQSVIIRLDSPSWILKTSHV